MKLDAHLEYKVFTEEAAEAGSNMTERTVNQGFNPLVFSMGIVYRLMECCFAMLRTLILTNLSLATPGEHVNNRPTETRLSASQNTTMRH